MCSLGICMEVKASKLGKRFAIGLHVYMYGGSDWSYIDSCKPPVEGHVNNLL